MSQVNIGKVKQSFRTRMKGEVAGDQFRPLTNDGAIPEEVSVGQDLVNAIALMERHDSFNVNTASLRLNSESQRVLSLPIRLQPHKATWTTFFEARNMAGSQMLATAVAALQHHKAQLKASNNAEGGELMRGKKQPQGGAVGGKGVLLDVSSNSKLDLELGFMAHVWRSPEGAVAFNHGFTHIWQTLFEYHLEGIHVPMSIMFHVGGTYVSVTALPPCYVEGLVSRGEAPKMYPADSTNATSDQCILSHTCKELMTALRCPVANEDGTPAGLPMFTSRDGRHYLLSLAEVLKPQRLTTFPFHVARKDCLWKMLIHPAYSSTATALTPEHYLIHVAIPAMVQALWEKMHLWLSRHPTASSKEMCVKFLLAGNVLRSAMREHGINMTLLFHVHQYVFAQAKKYHKNPPQPREEKLQRVTSGSGGDFGRVDSGVISPTALTKRPSFGALLGSNAEQRDAVLSPALSASFSGGFQSSDDEQPPEEDEPFIPENVVNLSRQILICCRTEMVGRVLKAFARRDIEKSHREGRVSESDTLDVINFLCKMTTDAANASFWADHLMPALRHKFHAPATFNLTDKEVHMASAIGIMSSKLGAEFDTHEGKGRFFKLAKTSKTDHVCLSVPTYLLRDDVKRDSTQKIIQQCWDAVDSAFVTHNSILHQILVTRATCTSLQMGSAHAELVESVLGFVETDYKVEDGDIAKLRFAGLASELPLPVEEQAELIKDLSNRIQKFWPNEGRDGPGSVLPQDGAILALKLGGAGRTLEVMLQQAAAQDLGKIAIAARSEHNLDELQLRIDALSTSVKIPGINVAFCLLTQALTREVLRHIPLATDDQRVSLAFVLRGLVVNLSYGNNEKGQAAELAIDALTAFMTKEEHYRSVQTVDPLTELACEGVEANIEVFGRDCIDTQNMVYRLAKVAVINHKISKLDGALQGLITKAADARLEVKKVMTATNGGQGGGSATLADAPGKLLENQMSLLTVGRKKAPVAALRKAGTITESARAKKLLLEHADYLGGATEESQSTAQDTAVFCIQRMARAKNGATRVSRVLALSEERKCQAATERADAAKRIQSVARKRIERNEAKQEMQKRILQLHASRKAQALLRAITSWKQVRLLQLLNCQQAGTCVIQRCYRSRVGYRSVQWELSAQAAALADDDAEGEEEAKVEARHVTESMQAMYEREYDPVAAASETVDILEENAARVQLADSMNEPGQFSLSTESAPFDRSHSPAGQFSASSDSVPFGRSLGSDDVVATQSLDPLPTAEQQQSPEWRSLYFEQKAQRHYIHTLYKQCVVALTHLTFRFRHWGVKSANQRRSSLRVMQLKQRHSEGGGGTLLPPCGAASNDPPADSKTAAVLGTHIAARKIQCAWRCNIARFERRLRWFRRHYSQTCRSKHLAARKIQSVFRSFWCRYQIAAAGTKEADTQLGKQAKSTKATPAGGRQPRKVVVNHAAETGATERQHR